MSGPSRLGIVRSGFDSEMDKFMSETSRLRGGVEPPPRKARKTGDSVASEMSTSRTAQERIVELTCEVCDLKKELASERASRKLYESSVEAVAKKRATAVVEGEQTKDDVLAQNEKYIQRFTALKNDKEEAERKSKQAESEVLELQQEYDQLNHKYSSELARYRRNEDDLKARLGNANRRAKDAGAVSSSEAFGQSDIEHEYKQEVEKLRRENAKLHEESEQAQRSNRWNERLIQQHKEYELQLKKAKADLEELADWKTRHTLLEQEVEGLQHALSSREDVQHELDDAQRKCAALERQNKSWEDTAKTVLGSSEVSPFALTRVWTSLINDKATMERRWNESQSQIDILTSDVARATTAQKHAQDQLKLQEERFKSSKRTADEHEHTIHRLTGQASALRQMLEGEKPDVAKNAPQPPKDGNEATQNSRLLEEKDSQIEELMQEAARLREQMATHASSDARLIGSERLVEELKQDNKSLLRQRDQLEKDLAALERRDAKGEFNQATTKVLTLKRRDHGLPTEADLLREQLAEVTQKLEAATTSGDSSKFSLELDQAVEKEKQKNERLENVILRERKAMKRHGNSLREGIYALLGWKISMNWNSQDEIIFTLSSKHCASGGELKFRLDSTDQNGNHSFKWLTTPWAQEIQGNRQAISYYSALESIPGMLAQLTLDTLTMQAMATSAASSLSKR